MSAGRMRTLPSIVSSVRRAMKRRARKKNSTLKILRGAFDKDSPFSRRDRMDYAKRQLRQKIPGLRKTRGQRMKESVQRGLKANLSSRPLREVYEGHKALVTKPSKTIGAGVKEIKKDKLLAALTVGFAGAEAADIARAHGPSESTLRKVRERLGPEHERSYKHYRERATRETLGGKHEQTGKAVGGNLSFLAMMARKRVPIVGHALGTLVGYHAGGRIGRQFDKPHKRQPDDRWSTADADRYVRAVERHVKRKRNY